MATSATSLCSSFSSLSIRTSHLSLLSATSNRPTPLYLSHHPKTPPLSLSSHSGHHHLRAKNDDIDTTFFDDLNPEEEVAFDPPARPEGFVAPRAIDEPPFESEEQIGLAYEELYGPAYSGESFMGKDVYVMDSKVKKSSGFRVRKEKTRDGFDERVIQVRRVTKVVKGGKQMRFRAIVVVGDKKGQVGVGHGKAKEVIEAVQKAATDARRNIITILKSEADYGAASVMLRPASPGTGVIAGGAVRIVLEMAGVENALGKQLGSNNALNNARATICAVQKMRQFREVAQERGIPMEELWK